jgi:hypothetical protein
MNPAIFCRRDLPCGYHILRGSPIPRTEVAGSTSIRGTAVKPPERALIPTGVAQTLGTTSSWYNALASHFS